MSNQIFLKATAASFKEAWRVVDILLQLSEDAHIMSQNKSDGNLRRKKERHVTAEQAEDVMYVFVYFLTFFLTNTTMQI